MSSVKNNACSILFVALAVTVSLFGYSVWLHNVAIQTLEADMQRVHTRLLLPTVVMVEGLIQPECDTPTLANFDDYLSRLPELNQTELVQLKMLYPRCAYARPFTLRILLTELDALERQYRWYQTQPFTFISFVLSARQSYALFDLLHQMQIERVQFTEELYRIQERIIDLRLAGEPLASPQYSSLQEQAAKLKADTSVAQTNIQRGLRMLSDV